MALIESEGNEIVRKSEPTVSFNDSCLEERDRVQSEDFIASQDFQKGSDGQDPVHNLIEKPKQTCKSCCQIITDSQYIKIAYKNPKTLDNEEVPGSDVWHLECVKCALCLSLIDYWGCRFFERDSLLYCPGCYFSHFYVTCHQCNSAIEETNPIKLEDKTFHTTCFRCSERSCSKKLSSLFQTQNGLPYCLDCFNFYFGKRCSKCDTTIDTDVQTGTLKYLTFNKKIFHLQCFKCQQQRCDNVIDSRAFSLVDRKVTCQTCVKHFYIPQPSGTNPAAAERTQIKTRENELEK